MQKFWILLQKEVRELLTPLVFVPIILTVTMFYGIGKISNHVSEQAQQPVKVTIVDDAHSAASNSVIETFRTAGANIQTKDNLDRASAIKTAEDNKSAALIIIPNNFGKNLEKGQAEILDVSMILRSFSMIGSKDSTTVELILAQLNTALGNQLIIQKTTTDPAIIRAPIAVNNHVVVNDKSADTTIAAVMTFIQSQIYFIPLILVIVIVFAGQMVATSISTEKENKTLETLLSSPVSRQSIVTSKLFAAGLVALLFAGVYMIGFRSYINGLSGMAGAGAVSGDIGKAAAQALGLTFSGNTYLLLGLTLFAAILVALSLALILGAFAEDSKSIQTLITPLMVLIMIPYFLVSFADINSFTTATKWLIYAIPFAHPFLAPQYLMLHNIMPVVWGIIYQIIIFAILVTIASRIFTTDAIVTMKLNFEKKR